MTSITLTEIEALAKRHADARATLVERVQRLEDSVTAAQREHARAIKGAVQTAAGTEAVLREAINANRSLFERPRTRILHGLKVGLRKQPGKLVWSDQARVVKLIRRHRPDDAETLIRVTEAPVRQALAQLPATELRRLGVQVIESEDAIEVKHTDSAIDKWVDSLLAGLRDEFEEEAA